MVMWGTVSSKILVKFDHRHAKDLTSLLSNTCNVSHIATFFFLAHYNLRTVRNIVCPSKDSI